MRKLTGLSVHIANLTGPNQRPGFDAASIFCALAAIGTITTIVSFLVLGIAGGMKW